MTNQASEDELDKILHGITGSKNLRPQRGVLARSRIEAKQAILELIRTEKLKLLDEVIHQSTVNLKSAKAVAGWAELRKEQLEAEL